MQSELDLLVIMEEKVKSDLYLEIEKRTASYLTKEGFTLVDMQIKGGKEKTVTLFVYNKDHTDIDTLAKINKLLYPAIQDVKDLSEDFTLEVSSPGIYRDIRSKQEFKIFKDRDIRIIMIDGRIINGISKGLSDDDHLLLEVEEKTEKISLKDINKAKLNG
jgi:ribosome maturation factor RimP